MGTYMTEALRNMCEEEERELRAESDRLRTELEVAHKEKRSEEATRWNQVMTQLAAVNNSLVEIKQLQASHGQEQTEMKQDLGRVMLILSGPLPNPEQGLMVRTREMERRVGDLTAAEQERIKGSSKLRDLGITTIISLVTGSFLVWLKTKIWP